MATLPIQQLLKSSITVSGYSGYSGYGGGGGGTSGYSGYSGFSGTTNVYLGDPTTGNYSSGLFPWVANVTLIADAEQSVNEVLAALAPSPAPVYSAYNISQTGVNGKLSYGSSNPLAGVTSVTGIGTTAPVSTAVDTDGSFTASGMRKGIFGTSTTSWTGTLNSQVTAGAGTPSNAYPQYSFLCDNGQGNLYIYVNDDVVPKHTLDLSTFSSGNSLNANGTGFSNVSALTSELFPNGTQFTLFKYRTANLVINTNDCRDGWNWVRVTQIVGASTRPTINYYGDFVRDANTTATTFSSESMSSFAGSGSKYLSGIQYYTGGSATYTVTISNLYKNTYYSSSDALAYGNNSTPLQSVANESLGNSGGNTSLTVVPSKTVNITTSGIRLNPTAGSTITLKTTAKRTVQSTATSTGASVTNILVDNVSASSTITVEDFNDETYRLPSNSDFDAQATGTTGSWTSSNSIKDAGSAGYNDGLQVYNSTLVIPSINFSTITNGPSNLDYSTGVSGTRTYYRFFTMATARSNFTITVSGTATPRAYSYSMTNGTNDMKIAIKLPNSGGEGTGWMDPTALFATAAWTDGSGCLNSGTFSMNSAMSITVGTKSTGSPTVNGKVFLRITVPQGWTGSLTTISLVGA